MRRAVLLIPFWVAGSFAADFGKNETSWEKITPKASEEKWSLGSEGFLSHTSPVNASSFPERHSYSWMHFYGHYQLVPRYSLSALATVQKTSFSYDLDSDPYRIRVFPQLSFDGTLRHLLPIEGLPDSGHRIHFQAGTIPMFRHGHGLYYSQFTGTGFYLTAEIPWFSLELAQLGYGYYAGDDIRSFYLYVPGRYFGIGILQEFSAPFGDRMNPGFAGEILPWKFIRLYYEAGSSWVYAQTGITRFSYYDISRPEYTIDLSQVSFRENFHADRGSLAGLLGIDLHWSKFWGVAERLLLSHQIRYYGAEATNFYDLQRRSHFNYFTDLTTDQRYNNQPYNFYLYPGASLGAYLLQEIDIYPVKYLKIALRNELLVIRSENKYAQSGYGEKISGNDLLSLLVAFTFEEKLNMGIKFSNVLIGDVEYGTSDFQIARTRTPFMLEASNFWLVDLFLHYRI